MMNEKVTIESIKETGFSSWIDFFLSITQISSINTVTHYEYMKTPKEVAHIKLQLTSNQLESLVLYESRKFLRPFGTSFEELAEKARGHEFYEQEFVTENENGETELHKIKIKRSDLVTLSGVERGTPIEFIPTVEDERRKY